MKRSAEKCLNLNSEGLEIKINEEFFPNFEGTIIPVQIGENYFEITITDKEIDRADKKYNSLFECQYETIRGIVALEKLLKLLKLGLDISFSNELIK